jgi:hypothetical protein
MVGTSAASAVAFPRATAMHELSGMHVRQRGRQRTEEEVLLPAIVSVTTWPLAL